MWAVYMMWANPSCGLASASPTSWTTGLVFLIHTVLQCPAEHSQMDDDGPYTWFMTSPFYPACRCLLEDTVWCMCFMCAPGIRQYHVTINHRATVHIQHSSFSTIRGILCLLQHRYCRYIHTHTHTHTHTYTHIHIHIHKQRVAYTKITRFGTQHKLLITVSWDSHCSRYHPQLRR